MGNHHDAIGKVLRAGRSGTPRDLERAGVGIVNRLRTLLSTPGTGSLYTTRFFTTSTGRVVPYGSRPPHRASAPGQPPAPDTGRLRASYGASASRTPDGAELEVASGLEYAPYLEFGTTQVEARPHLRPAMEQGKATVRDEVSDGIVGREKAMARRLGGKG